jgi:hypothetical protein
MSDYTEFAFRSPDVATFLSDVESICQNNGIDPYERDILRKDRERNAPHRRLADRLPCADVVA